ncbi:unnamed protein product [Litomosoides sigmodontis]|uniref:Meckelin n=1 Tax=Litomosoides sigmodontis TaxID=42156 RepID=A0A3P6U338_LITSI|nr:unnamed protein product [Litomosoides sigmodontis]
MIYSLFLLLFTHAIYSTYHTQLLFDYITPRNCSNFTAYFDAVNLQCRNCVKNTIASGNHLHCLCPAGSIQISTDTCQKCEQGRKANDNGHFCVECPLSQSEIECLCPPRYFMKRTVTADGILVEEKCAKCPSNKKVSSSGDSCVPCLKTDDICKCQDDSKMCEKVERNKMLARIEFENGSQESSSYIARNIRKAVQGCYSNSTQACQHLANICVLQNYRTDKPSACTEFEKIANSMLYKRENGLLNAPILFYSSSEASTELLHGSAISGSFSFDRLRPNAFLEIILVQYALNGTFLGVVPLSESNLNACSQQKDKFHFGTFYKMKCFIQFQHLLHLSGGQPIFSDFYIAFLNGMGQKQMYAMPILNENIRLHGEFVNRLTPNEIYNPKWILTRRLYFVDAISFDASPPSKASQHSDTIRFPEKIGINVRLQSGSDGRIMSPYVRVRHAEAEWDPEKQLLLQFEISYFVNGSQLFQYIEIALFILAFLSFIYSAIRAYSWGKRSGKMIIDSATAHLILAKTFFIDWERPHVTFDTSSSAPPSSTRKNVKITQPVIWRTYLVANEWNELQDYRKTSVGLQMITMIALLHWLKVENWSVLTAGLSAEIPTFSTSTTLSELAIISSVYLTVSMIQWLLRITIVERFLLDPFHNMIDLCSISNISVLILTHPLHGYYIHGRSVHDQADTDMIRMNQYLYRERENLCGTRGLETGSDLQTYIINLPRSFREQFDVASKLLESDMEQFDKSTTNHFDATSTNIQKIAKEQMFKRTHFEQTNNKVEIKSKVTSERYFRYMNN